MINLSEMLVESINESKKKMEWKKFGAEQVVPEIELKDFKGSVKPYLVVTYKEEGDYKLVWCRVDYWNKALWLRVGITNQNKYCVAAWKNDNIEYLDFGPRKNAAVAYVNGYEYSGIKMGGKIQYTFDEKEYEALKKAFEDRDKDLFDKIENTIKTLEEYN